MKKALLILATGLSLSGAALAQAPAAPAQAPALTQEQAQQIMLRQMQMMAAMFDYRRSRLGFDETLAALSDRAVKRGWSTPQIHDVQAAMKKAGATDAKRMKSLATCPPNANERLAKASGGKLPPLPCRYTVFEGQDGKIFVMRMNTHILAKTVPDEAGKVMLDIAGEEDALLKGIAE
jgi:uncharacterized protein (DUF302 family)